MTQTNPFNCPVCKKDWPTNYCPECARTIERTVPDDELIIDGDIIRDSWSTCAAKIRLNPVRYLWFKSETRLLLQVWLALAVVTIFACVMKWWIAGGILLVLTMPLTGLLWWISRRVAEIYQNAALTAGMVVSQHPLEFISIADMDAGVGEIAYAVKRVAISRLPCHSEEIGTQFPCVSGFQDGPTPTQWGDFDPQPLSFGTGDTELLQARRTKLGEEAFAELRRAFERGKYPKQAGQLIWLDERNAPKIPPLLPKL